MIVFYIHILLAVAAIILCIATHENAWLLVLALLMCPLVGPIVIIAASISYLIRKYNENQESK